jgi:LPLT family lysophospholipid transporter-like MFS transporter
MTKSFFALLMAQFLSAFADNAVLFTIISIVIHSPDNPQWYVPALQSAFLIAFVVLAPWSGYVADRFAKSQVL